MRNFFGWVVTIVGGALFVLIILAKVLAHMGPDAAKALAKSGDDAITALGKNAGLSDEMVQGADLKIPVHPPDPIPMPDPSGKWYAGEAAARAVAHAAQCTHERMQVAADMTPLMESPDDYVKSLGYINKGQPVCVDEIEGEWSHVHSGWIQSRFLIASK
jgi:hypothetical protein